MSKSEQISWDDLDLEPRTEERPQFERARYRSAIAEPSTFERPDSAKAICRNCDSHVTRQFVRVYGDNDGRLFACVNCATGRELREGAGTDAQFDGGVL